MAIAPGGVIGIATVKIEPDGSGFQREVRRHANAAEKDPRNRVKTKVDADTSGADKAFQKLRRTLTSVAGAVLGFKAIMFAIKWPAIQAGGVLAAQAISQLTAALVAFVGSAGAALGVLAALPSALAALGQVAGTVMLAFGGIGDAVKASDKVMRGGGKATTDTARQHELAARRIRDAVEARARAVEDAAEREREAQEAVQQAIKDLEDAYEDSARAGEAASRRVSAAEKNLADSQKAARQAQQDLTRAREEEAKALAELREELARNEEQYALDEERQQLAVDRAKEYREAVFADEGSSDRERQEADLRFREEEFRLKELKRRREENRKAQAEAAKATVEESERVRAAKERERASNEAVEEAELRVAEARRDQAEVAEDSAERIAAAQENLARAQANVGRVSIDNARQLRDATEAVSDALYAMNDAATTAGGGVDQFREAMAKLSPAGKRFVEFITKELKPRIEELRKSAQEGLLPGLQAGIESSLVLFEPLRKGLYETGQAMGETARQAGLLMATPAFQKQFADILKTNVDLTRIFGDAFLNLFEALVAFMAAPAVRDFVTWLAEGIRGWSEWVKNTLAAKEASGGLKIFFDEVKESVRLVVDILGNLTGTLFNLFKGGKETGDGFLLSLSNITQKWQDWTGSVEGQNKLKEWFEASKPLMKELGDLIRDVVKAIGELSGEQKGGLADTVKFLRTDILPILKEFFGSSSDAFRKELLVAIREFVELFTKLAGQSGPMGGFVGSLGKVLKVINDLLDKFPQLKGAIIGISTVVAISQPFQPLLTGLLVLQRSLPEGVKLLDIVPKGFKKMSSGIKTAVGGIQTLFSNPYFLWGALIVGVIALVVLIVKNWDEIKEAIGKAVDWISEKISGAWNWIQETTGKIWDGIKEFFRKHWDELLIIFLGPLGFIIQWVIKHWEDIKNKTHEIWTNIKEFFKGIWQGITSAIGSAVDWIGSKVSGAWEWLRGVATTVWNGISAAVMAPVNWIREKVPEAFNWVRDKIAGAWDWVKSKTDGIWEGMKSGAKGMANAIIGVLNGLINGWEKAINFLIRGYNRFANLAVNPLPPISEVNFGEIPKLATGGIMKKGGLALIGEKGPELVSLPAGARVYSARETQAIAEKGLNSWTATGGPRAIGGDGASAIGQLVLNVTSQRPDDIAGPVGRELAWQMARTALSRR